jgi:putative metalloprotease
MKKILILALALTCSAVSAQIKIGAKAGRLIDAGLNTVKAVTLSDADVAALCRESVAWMDANSPVADETTAHSQRLARLTANLKSVNGMPLNFKVYDVPDINAFASGDGSIRVFGGLMEIMDDDELMAIIGHEIGHVANGDVRDAMKMAHGIAAAKSGIGAIGGAAKFTDSQWGDLTGAFMESKFSRDQENEADDYGMRVCVENGFSPYGMANSLDELVRLSEGGAQASAVQKMFSSHPDSAARAARMRAAADSFAAK